MDDAAAKENICAVILAAGKGTRMKSERAKVLHEVFGSPMVCHVIDAVKAAGIHDVVVVVGHQVEKVQACLATFEVKLALQEEQLGTGHAVLCAKPEIGEEHSQILILCGDTPLISSATLAHFKEHHKASGAAVTVMSTIVDDATNYGRIIVDEKGAILRIVEEKDASESERLIKEINAGVYLVEKTFLFDALLRVGNDNSQGEVYLTDIVSIAHRMNLLVNRYPCSDPSEVTGVNSRVELAAVEKCFRDRRNADLMRSGVTMQDPSSTFIDREVVIGKDTLIRAHVHLRGQTVIGERCVIDCFSVLSDCNLGDGVVIAPFSNLWNKTVRDGEQGS